MKATVWIEEKNKYWWGRKATNIRKKINEKEKKKERKRQQLKERIKRERKVGDHGTKRGKKTKKQAYGRSSGCCLMD